MTSHHGSWYSSGWLLIALLLVVTVCALIGAVVFIAADRAGRSAARHDTAGLPRRAPDPGAASDPGALRVLENRFARGEIDADEFRTRRDLLRGAP